MLSMPSSSEGRPSLSSIEEIKRVNDDALMRCNDQSTVLPGILQHHATTCINNKYKILETDSLLPSFVLGGLFGHQGYFV